MKVGLINPGLKYKADRTNLDFHHLPGIAYVGATLKSRGYDIVNVDFMHDENANLDQVRDCDVVGVATYLNSYNFLKENLPKLERMGKFIMAGGPLISSYDLTKNNLVMKLFPEITAGVIGEAEDTVLDILDYYSDKIWARFPESGIVFRTRHHGKLEASENPGIEPGYLDSLPEIDYSDWPGFTKKAEGRTIDIAMSRGCYNKCSYCFHTNKGIRSFGLSRIEKELTKVAALKPREVTFTDDVFTYDPARAIGIGKILKSYGLKYGIETRANDMNPTLARSLAETGCTHVRYGVESFDQRVLDMAHKNVKVENIYQAIKITQDAGIITGGFFLFGLPGETRESIEKTLKGIERTQILPRARVVIPLPGTEIYQTLVSQGRIDEIEMLKSFSESSHLDSAEGDWVPVNLTEDVSDQELLNARNRAMELRDKFEMEGAR